MKNALSYRKDIDGLRALAVLSVIFFHMGSNTLSGGFVGVDVFFVISGYLITSLILRELEAGKFSFNNFWLRRIRRILPASLVMMLSVAIVFAFVFPPDLYRNLGQSLLAQGLFAANFLFWLESGYFDTSSELKPLLHTWSLAVEEQFYFIFPPLVWMLYRYAKRLLLPVLCLISILSFGLSIVLTEHYPDAAFYLLPTRAWELGVGGLLALTPKRYLEFDALVSNLVSFAGLALIITALLHFDQATPFPSYTAILPTLGTAMIICGNRNSSAVLHKLFSLRIVVGIGLISYSLYLWHWPILVFNSWIHIGEPELSSLIVSTMLMFLLATLSYFLVEQPVRTNVMVYTNFRLVALSGFLVSTVIILGSVIHLSNGLPDRNKHTKYLADSGLFTRLPDHTARCHSKYNRDPDNPICEYQSFNSALDSPFLIWGDSHANAIIPAFEQASKATRRNFVSASYSGCPPILNIVRTDRPVNDGCHDFNETVFEYAIANQVELVFLVWRHNQYVEGWEDDSNTAQQPFIAAREKYSGQHTRNTAFAAFSENLLKTVNGLAEHGIRSVVIRQIPNFTANPVLAMQKFVMLEPETATDYFRRPRAEIDSRSSRTTEFFDRNSVEYIDLNDLFCDMEYCYAIRGGELLYRDDHHLGLNGAKFIEGEIEDLLRSQLASE